MPEKIRNAVRNHGGGHASHTFFWQILKRDVALTGDIANAITSKFGSFDTFKKEFTSAATLLFGNGWAWLVLADGQLEIMTTPNQDSPLSQNKQPLLGLDVWEHAYYLTYQNRRPDYVDVFFNIVNWDKAEELYQASK